MVVFLVSTVVMIVLVGCGMVECASCGKGWGVR